MVTVRVYSKLEKLKVKIGCFYTHTHTHTHTHTQKKQVGKNSRFVGVFNKTIIALARLLDMRWL